MKHTWSRGNCVPVRQVVSETEVAQWEVCFRTRQLTSRLKVKVKFKVKVKVYVRHDNNKTEVVRWKVCFRTRQLKFRLRESVVFIDMIYGRGKLFVF